MAELPLTQDGKRLYTVLSDHGQSMLYAQRLESARCQALRRVGSAHFYSVRPATEDEASWYLAMGGNPDVC